MVNANTTNSEKIVIQFGTRTVKGYLDSPACNTIEELLRNASHGSPQTFRIRHLESDVVEEIPTADVKAVFYVNSFEGNSTHNHLTFSSRAPIVHGIWVSLPVPRW